MKDGLWSEMEKQRDKYDDSSALLKMPFKSREDVVRVGMRKRGY